MSYDIKIERFDKQKNMHRLGNFSGGYFFEVENDNTLFLSLYVKFNTIICKNLDSGLIVSFDCEENIYLVNNAKISYTISK